MTGSWSSGGAVGSTAGFDGFATTGLGDGQRGWAFVKEVSTVSFSKASKFCSTCLFQI